MKGSKSLVSVPIRYYEQWADGYGARGWKLDAAMDDPEIIASTSDHGVRIPTSVLIHDVLDHYLCGLPPSGHRAEAVALQQLAQRTGADPLPDLAQMVDEDLIHGRVLGETMLSILPDNLRRLLPSALMEDRAIAQHLVSILGKEVFRNVLIDRLADIGRDGAADAISHYEASGLLCSRRRALGLAMQSLLVEVDSLALRSEWTTAHAVFLLESDRCVLCIDLPINAKFESLYST